MRSTVFAAAAVCSVVALLWLAGTANASATIDLIWIDVSETNAEGDPICLLPANRNCAPDPRSYNDGAWIDFVPVTDSITLGVILTAGPNGSWGSGVSVNYSDVLPALSVVGFQRLATTLPLPYLPLHLGTTTNRSPYIDNINAAAGPPVGLGIGLPAGQSAYLGTVTFHKEFIVNQISEISVGTDGPGNTDGVLDGFGNLIDATTTFNSAYFVSQADDLPGCSFVDTDTGFGLPGMQIEVNALRASGKTVSAGPNQTVDVTAKARILKGTAARGNTIDTTLTIEARDGPTVVGTNSTAFEGVRLEVGKGGNGAKLAVGVPQCTLGFIEFVARFVGTDVDGDICVQTRKLRKACR